MREKVIRVILNFSTIRRDLAAHVKKKKHVKDAFHRLRLNLFN
jgi:hypothetical protein